MTNTEAKMKCEICKQVMDTEEEPVRSMNCGGHCVQCMAEAGDPDCIDSIVKWSRSIPFKTKVTT